MKQIKKFKEGEHIPSGAKFLHVEEGKKIPGRFAPELENLYVYEVEVEESEQLNKVLKTDMKK